MIYNFYTYLFFFAMTIGSSVAILIRTVKDSNRRTIWNVSSVSFLVLLIISFVILFTGLIFTDPVIDNLFLMILFAFIFFILFAIVFYFVKAVTFLIVLFILLGLIIYSKVYLKDFQAFEENGSYRIKLLQLQENKVVLELNDFNGDIAFVQIEKDEKYPVFLIVDFPKSLFFLNGSSFLKFNGCISDPDKLSAELEDNFIQSDISGFPFAKLRIYDSLAIKEEVFSVFSVETERGGVLKISSEK